MTRFDRVILGGDFTTFYCQVFKDSTLELRSIPISNSRERLPRTREGILCGLWENKKGSGIQRPDKRVNVGLIEGKRIEMGGNR